MKRIFAIFCTVIFSISIMACEPAERSKIDEAISKTYENNEQFVEEFSLMIYEYFQSSPSFSVDDWTADEAEDGSMIYAIQKDDSTIYLTFSGEETPVLEECIIWTNLSVEDIASLCEKYEEEGVLKDMYYTDIEDLYSPMYSTDLGYTGNEILETFKSDDGALGTFGAEYGIHARDFEISTHDYLSDTNVSIDIE